MHRIGDVIQLPQRPVGKVRPLASTIEPVAGEDGTVKLKIRTLAQSAIETPETVEKSVNCPVCADSGIVTCEDERGAWWGFRCSCTAGTTPSPSIPRITAETWGAIYNARVTL
jgi:hypothetical protein